MVLDSKIIAVFLFGRLAFLRTKPFGKMGITKTISKTRTKKGVENYVKADRLYVYASNISDDLVFKTSILGSDYFVRNNI